MFARLVVVTERESCCTAFAREQRWSETDVKLNEGVEDREGKDAGRGKVLGRITAGGFVEEGQTHLDMGGATQMRPLPLDGLSSSSAAASPLSPSEDPSPGTRVGIRVQIVALQEAVNSKG